MIKTKRYKVDTKPKITKNEQRLSDRTGKPIPKKEMSDIIVHAVTQSISYVDFVTRLQVAGIQAVPNISATTGRLSGFAFTTKTQHYKGSQLGYSNKKLQSLLPPMTTEDQQYLMSLRYSIPSSSQPTSPETKKMELRNGRNTAEDRKEITGNQACEMQDNDICHHRADYRDSDINSNVNNHADGHRTDTNITVNHSGHNNNIMEAGDIGRILPTIYQNLGVESPLVMAERRQAEAHRQKEQREREHQEYRKRHQEIQDRERARKARIDRAYADAEEYIDILHNTDIAEIQAIQGVASVMIGADGHDIGTVILVLQDIFQELDNKKIEKIIRDAAKQPGLYYGIISETRNQSMDGYVPI